MVRIKYIKKNSFKTIELIRFFFNFSNKKNSEFPRSYESAFFDYN